MKKIELKVSIETELHKLFKEYCKENGYTMNGLINNLIKKEIKKS
jgi:hypothetical protein